MTGRRGVGSTPVGPLQSMLRYCSQAQSLVFFVKPFAECLSITEDIPASSVQDKYHGILNPVKWPSCTSQVSSDNAKQGGVLLHQFLSKHHYECLALSVTDRYQRRYTRYKRRGVQKLSVLRCATPFFSAQRRVYLLYYLDPLGVDQCSSGGAGGAPKQVQKTLRIPV